MSLHDFIFSSFTKCTSFFFLCDISPLSNILWSWSYHPNLSLISSQVGLCSNIISDYPISCVWIHPSYHSISIFIKPFVPFPVTKFIFNWFSISQRTDFISSTERLSALSHYSPTKQGDLLYSKFCGFGASVTCGPIILPSQKELSSFQPYSHKYCLSYNILLKLFLFY